MHAAISNCSDPRTYDRKRQKPAPVTFVTYESNDWYNQRKILSRYTETWTVDKIGNGSAIPGKLQHGWQWGTGIDDEGVDRIRHTNVQSWVWNKRNETTAKDLHIKSVAIGAPILYSPIIDIAEEPITSGVLVIPSHSQPPFQIRQWEDTVRETNWFCNDFKQKTVLLYYRDYSYAKQFYENYGFTVCCLGGPYAKGYLDRLKLLILVHELVIGDKISTSSFYANMWNRPFLKLGSPLETEIIDPFAGPGGDNEFIEKEFPHFLTGKINKDLALKELGYKCKKSKSELKDLFNWR